jgi:hypothetical protein
VLAADPQINVSDGQRASTRARVGYPATAGENTA